MSDATLRCFALLGLITVVCVVVIAWRLRHLAVVRADAERRAAEAFEAMIRLGRDLRRRRETLASDSARSPGERLRAMYPGPTGSAGAMRERR